MPVVICQLASGESMITEKGSMVWMSPNIEMQTSAGGMDWLNAGVFAAGLLLLLLRPRTDPILVMVGAGLIGLIGYSWLPL